MKRIHVANPSGRPRKRPWATRATPTSSAPIGRRAAPGVPALGRGAEPDAAPAPSEG